MSDTAIPIHCAHHAVISIHDLKPHPANPKKHPQKQLVVYAQAIRETGWREAVTVSKRSGFIVTGHGAVEAARLVPTDQIPVEYQDYDSDEAELADLLAQNRIGELGGIDKDKLKDALARIAKGEAVKSIVTGYSAEVVAKLFKLAAPGPQYPIVARLNEAHHLLCIPVESATDWQFLKNLVGVRTEQSYKNETIGEAHVVPFARFL
jgi:ParB-like chromosome segregation protein Spo0J